MALQLKLAPPLGSAMLWALLQQAVVLFLTFGTRNAEELAQVALFAFVSFWCGVGILIARRGMLPRKLDLVVVSYGYLPLCVIALYLSRSIWDFRGY